MTRNLVLLSFMTFGQLAFSAQSFHCYVAPGYPIQAYEYNTMCGDKGSTEPVALKDVICTYQAACQPVSENDAKLAPKDLEYTAIQNGIGKGELKPSTLICKGKGKTQNGVLLAHCPPPTDCQKDIFYNQTPVGVTSTLVEPVSVPARNSETR